MEDEIYPWMRHAKKKDLTLCKSLLLLFVITTLLFAGIYFTA